MNRGRSKGYALPRVYGRIPQYPLERYLNIRSSHSPTLSPDAGRIAFLTNITGVPQLWEVDREGGWPDQRTFFPERVASPAYAPTSTDIVFQMDVGGNERFQVWHLSRDKSDLRPLTTAHDAIHALGRWSRDGGHLCYSANARDPRFFDVYVRDVETGEARRVYAQDGSNFARSFTPDGRAILVFRLNAPFDHDLFIVDAETGDARHLTPHAGEIAYHQPDVSADGKHVYALSDADREFDALVRLELRRLTWTTVWEEPWGVEELALSLDGRLAAIVVNEGGYHRLKVVRLRDRKLVAQPALPQGAIAQPAWSNDGRYLAFTFQSPAHNPDVWVLNVRKDAAGQVTHSSCAGIPRESFVIPQRAGYPTFDGRDVPAFLYRAAGGRAPVVVWVHGGPEGQTIATFNPLIQYLSSRGYAILAPNVRGSTGYGKAYHHLDDVEKRMDSVADLKYAAEWLRTRDDVDGSRIAVIGGSYGGFMVLASLTEYPDAWSAGVDIVGIANFVTFLENTGPWRRAWREAEYGSLMRDRELLERISPVHKADRIRSPLFVIHGKNDPRVPLGETEQIVDAVRRRGGIVDLLVFPDEGHGLVRLSNRIRGYTAAVDFLDKHMAGGG